MMLAGGSTAREKSATQASPPLDPSADNSLNEDSTIEGNFPLTSKLL